MEGVSHRARNFAYFTFRYKGTKYLLHIPLYPTTANICRSQAYATSIPKSTSMEYFKSIHHVRSVCICIEVQCPQTCSYTGNIPPKAWKSKICVRQLNSTYFDLERKQNVLHKTQPSQAKDSIRNSSKSLVSRMKTDLRLQINNILPKLWPLHTYGTIAQATKLTTTHPRQA